MLLDGPVGVPVRGAPEKCRGPTAAPEDDHCDAIQPAD